MRLNSKCKSAIVCVGLLSFLVQPCCAAAQGREAGLAGEKARQRLSRVKVVSICENVAGAVDLGRPMAETIRMLKETHTDLLLRGFWKRGAAPMLESPDDVDAELAPAFSDTILSRIKETGYYYKRLEAAIAEIKRDCPDIIFIGAIPAQVVVRVERNSVTGKIYGPAETWKMALDPQKWGVKRNGKPWLKQEFQGHSAAAARHFPDITNPQFQELFLSWAKKQIDCGADGIWIDALNWQAGRLYGATKDANHPAVKETIIAVQKMVDEIHEYGAAHNKYIYVGSWDLGKWRVLNFDFITWTPSSQEVRDRKLDEGKWRKHPSARQMLGNIPLFAYIDWGGEKDPIAVFTQELSTEDRRNALTEFDKSFAKFGANFAYPLRGGPMGSSARTLAFGKSHFFCDSLAPEFGTYETIRELAQKKSRRPPMP